MRDIISSTILGLEVTDLIYDFSALFNGEQKNFASADGSVRCENGILYLKDKMDAASFSEDVVNGIVEYTGLASVKADMIELCLNISTCLTVICSRCSAETEKTNNISATFMLTNSDSRAPGPEQSDEVIFIENGILDIDELVRQTVILNFPMRFLCSDDCKGLCPKCGTDLNKNSCNCPTFEPDPRLAKLKDYLTKHENHTNEEVE